MIETLWEGILETLYMTVVSTGFAYILGLPIGVILYVTDKGGTHPIFWLNRLLGFVVNFLRSVPFIILLVWVIPALLSGRLSAPRR